VIRATNGKGGKGSDRRPIARDADPRRVALFTAIAYGEITREEFDRKLQCLSQEIQKNR
jgi:hypothetical protein